MAEIGKVRYTHDAVIDIILANPAVSQGDLAREFGFTQAWMSIIINSDAFKARLAERKGELLDPKIKASMEARLEALGNRALDRLLERVESSVPLKPLELVAMAKLGAGDRMNRPPAGPATNNLYVIAMPPAAANSTEWLSSTRRAPQGVFPQTIEADGGFTPLPLENL